MGIQEGVSVVHPAQGLDGPGGVEEGLREGGFPGVHMGQHAQHQFFMFNGMIHGITSEGEMVSL